MLLSKDFGILRLASSFTMTPQQAVGTLGIQSTGTLVGDRDLLKGLLRQYHPDVAKDEDAPIKMKAVNVLWEMFIRQGKPIDIHSQPQQQSWNPGSWGSSSWDRRYGDPVYEGWPYEEYSHNDEYGEYDMDQEYDEESESEYDEEDMDSGPNLEDWLWANVPDIENDIDYIIHRLEKAVEDLQRGSSEDLDARLRTAFNRLPELRKLIDDGGYADPRRGGEYGMQLRNIMDGLGLVENGLRHVKEMLNRRGPEVTATYLQKRVDELRALVENHSILKEYRYDYGNSDEEGTSEGGQSGGLDPVRSGSRRSSLPKSRNFLMGVDLEDMPWPLQKAFDVLALSAKKDSLSANQVASAFQASDQKLQEETGRTAVELIRDLNAFVQFPNQNSE